MTKNLDCVMMCQKEVTLLQEVKLKAMAFDALEVLKEKGVSVPEELSVFGFDNIALAATQVSPLMTMGQPLSLLGTRAVELLLTQIANQHE